MATLSPLAPALSAMDSSGKQSDISALQTTTSKSTTMALANANISSPHELTDWVDSVLDQLETRFDSMSGQVESRMKEMSNRIDALESSIEELITGVSAPLPKPDKEEANANTSGDVRQEAA